MFDLSQLEPTVACHPDPGQRQAAQGTRQHRPRSRVHRFVHRR
jgi:hypothetical protein